MLNGRWPHGLSTWNWALVGAFFVIVQPVVEPMDRFTAVLWTLLPFQPLILMNPQQAAASSNAWCFAPSGHGSNLPENCNYQLWTQWRDISWSGVNMTTLSRWRDTPSPPSVPSSRPHSPPPAGVSIYTASTLLYLFIIYSTQYLYLLTLYSINTQYLLYIYSGLYDRVWDEADYVVPPAENGAFFVTTNVVITPNQTWGHCPEVGCT